MMRRFAPLVLVALLAASGFARAEIYRYRDPETGQMKYTNVPPPWLKHPRPGAPKVEVIREPAPSATPPPEAAPKAAREAPAPTLAPRQ